MDITLNTAVLEVHNDCVLALHWYKHLKDKQSYIDTLGIHRAMYIRQFVIAALWYIEEIDSNGFDADVLHDLQSRLQNHIERKELLS